MMTEKPIIGLSLVLKTLINILDVVNSRLSIKEGPEFSELNNLYAILIQTPTVIEELPLDYVNVFDILPTDLRDGSNYLESNYTDSIRHRLINLSESAITEASSNRSEEDYTFEVFASKVINNFASLPDLDLLNLPKSLSKLNGSKAEDDVVFEFVFDSNTDTLSVNGITIRTLNTTSSFAEILLEAYENPGKPVPSDSKIPRFISELKIPKSIKNIFFPIKGKSKLVISPKITKQMLIDKNIDVNEIEAELKAKNQ